MVTIVIHPNDGKLYLPFNLENEKKWLGLQIILLGVHSDLNWKAWKLPQKGFHSWPAAGNMLVLSRYLGLNRRPSFWKLKPCTEYLIVSPQPRFHRINYHSCTTPIKCMSLKRFYLNSKTIEGHGLTGPHGEMDAKNLVPNFRKPYLRHRMLLRLKKRCASCRSCTYFRAASSVWLATFSDYGSMGYTWKARKQNSPLRQIPSLTQKAGSIKTE